MNTDPQYVRDLEELVTKLIPVYDRYYDLTGAPKPPLENLALKYKLQKTPALLKKWPLNT